MKRIRRKELRRGFTTGACAAAAAKAAATALLTQEVVKEIEITLPTGEKVKFDIADCRFDKGWARAGVIKDAGDDPDVTNGAEIVAEVRIVGSGVRGQESSGKSLASCPLPLIMVKGGEGVGVVTRPGLAVPVGEPAINPVPKKMIEKAVSEVLSQQSSMVGSPLTVIISAPRGKEIAKKTMNARLGIIDGISILGTTGIVEPLSLDAYKQSISCAIDVAIASNCKELVFSTGRSSEKEVEKVLGLPEESFILMGDHMGYALKEARGKRQGAGQKNSSRFTVHSSPKKITIAGQFGKISKMAAGHFETHCSDSNVELNFLASLAREVRADKVIVERIRKANTAREVFSILQENRLKKVFKMVCERVKKNAEMIVERNLEVGCMLVGYNNEIIERV